MTKHKDWFGVDIQKKAARVRGLPLAWALKELVANALDAGATDIRLSFMRKTRGRSPSDSWNVVCVDNGRGCSEPETLRRVGSSTSDLNPETRGRFGQGLIDFLSICKSAKIHTLTHTLEFWPGGCAIDRAPQALQGMAIEAVASHPDDGADGMRLLDSIILPAGVALEINGRKIEPRAIERQTTLALLTVAYDPERERVQRYQRSAGVQILSAAGVPKIYELGIAVDEMPWCLPFDVNVLQKTPLDTDRMMLPDRYKQTLLQRLAPFMSDLYDAQIATHKLVPAELKNCATLAQAMPESTRKLVVETVCMAPIEKIVRRNPFDLDDSSESAELEASGFAPFNTGALPDGVRALLKDAPTVAATHDQQCKAHFTTGSIIATTAWHNACMNAWSIIATGIMGRLISCMPCKSGNVAAAWDSGTILWNLEQPGLWEEPLAEFPLSVLIHELAHAKTSGHSPEFHSEVERIGAHFGLWIAGHIDVWRGLEHTISALVD